MRARLVTRFSMRWMVRVLKRKVFVYCKVALDEGLDTGGQRNHPALGFGAEGTAFAVDHQAVGLPVEVGSFEVGKLGDPESRVEKDPDNEFLFVEV